MGNAKKSASPHRLNAIVLAMILAGITGVSGLAFGQTTTPVTTDALGNTTVGPCAPTEGPATGANFVACTSGGTTTIGANSTNEIVIGSATIGVAPGSFFTSNNITIGSNNAIASDPNFGGSFNTLLGGSISVQGASNVGIGFFALNGQDGQLDTAVGYSALSSPIGPSTQTTALGARAGVGSGTTNLTTLLGNSAGANLVGATQSNVVGGFAATGATLTSSDVIGEGAGGASVLSASQVVGFQAGQQAQLSNSQAIGAQAGLLSNGSLNVYVGDEAGAFVTGNQNVLIGARGTPILSMTLNDSVSLGALTTPASFSVVLGVQASATQINSVVDGFNAASTGLDSVVLGAGSSDGGQDNVVSVGTTLAPRRITNVGPGAITQLSQDAVNGSQLWTVQSNSLQWSAGGFDASHAGTNQQIHNLAAGTATADAVNVGQLNAVAATVGNAVEYDNVGQTSVTLGGAAAMAPVLLTNVAPGGLSASSSDAVNGAQLFSTNQSLTSVANSLTGVGNSVTALQDTALQWSATGYDATHAGTAQQIHNLAAGTAAADAVNLGQLNAVATTAGNAVQYDNVGQSSVTLGGTAAPAAVLLSNVAPGNLSASSVDAVNGAQLYATNQDVQSNTRNIAGLSSSVSSFGQSLTTLQGAALQFNGSAYSASQGGVAQRISDVAAGTAATDAVNLAQLDAVSATAAGIGVQYDSAAQTRVTLGGVGSATPVTVANVAPGSITSSSLDAVNGSQLNATNQAVAANTTSISTLQSSYAGLAGGAITWNTTLNAWDASHGSVSPQRISSVAAGTATTDAVNVGQLDNAIAQSSGGGSASLGPVAAALGGGASVNAGVFVAPSYSIQGTAYSNVGSALSAVNTSLTTLNGDVAALQSSSSLGAASTTTTTTTTTTPSGSNQTTSTPTITLGGQAVSSPVELRNVAAGQTSNDAANVQQVDVAVKEAESYADTMSASAVTNANNYTNTMVSNLADQFNAQFNQLNKKISQQCAMGTAMTSMVGAAAGATDDGRVAAGAGACSGGAGAVAVGYATPIGERVHLDLGASFSAGQGSIGVGVGWDVP